MGARERQLADLAGVAGRAVGATHDGLAVQDRPPDRCGLAGGGLEVDGEAVHAGFGEAVALLEADAAGREGVAERQRARRAARDGPPDAPQVGAGEVRVLREHLEHGRHHEEQGGAELVDQAEVGPGIEARHEGDAGAERVERGGERVDGGVETGRRLHGQVVVAQPPGEDGGGGVGGLLPVREHGALGAAGGPAGEQDHLGVLGADAGGGGRFGVAEPGLVVLERDRRYAQAARQRGVRRIVQEQARPQVLDHGAQLHGAEARVERRVHDGRLGGRQPQVEVRQVVVGEDRDPVEALDPQRVEAPGEAFRAALHDAVAGPAAAPVDGRAVGGDRGAEARDVEGHGAAPASSPALPDPAHRSVIAFHTYPTPAATSTTRSPGASRPRRAASSSERIWSIWPRCP